MEHCCPAPAHNYNSLTAAEVRWEELLAGNYVCLEDRDEDTGADTWPTGILLFDKLLSAAHSGVVATEKSTQLIKSWVPACKEFLKKFEDPVEEERVDASPVTFNCLKQELSRAHEEIAEQKKRIHKLVLRQQQQMIHLGLQMVQVVRTGNSNSGQALANQAKLHNQQLQRQQSEYQKHCNTMQQHIGCLQHALRQQALHSQPQAKRFSSEKQQQYCAWLQDQLSACRSQLAEQQEQSHAFLMQQHGTQASAQLQQHMGPGQLAEQPEQPSLSLMQLRGSLSTEQLKQQRQQATVAELQQRAVSLEAELQQAQTPSFAELQQHVAQLEEQLQQCRGQLQEYRGKPTAAEWQKRVSQLEDDLQKVTDQPLPVQWQSRVSHLEEQLQQCRGQLQQYRGQPSSAQWQKRVLQLEDALGKQIQQHAEAEGKVKAGVEILKRKFCSTAYDREKKLNNEHAAEVQAQEERLRRQTLDITRLSRENEQLKAQLTEAAAGVTADRESHHGHILMQFPAQGNQYTAIHAAPATPATQLQVAASETRTDNTAPVNMVGGGDKDGVANGGMEHQIGKESVTGHFATALISHQKGVSSALRMSATNASLTASDQNPGDVTFGGQRTTQGNDGIADNHSNSRIAAVHSNSPKGQKSIAAVNSKKEGVSRFHAAIDSNDQSGEGALCPNEDNSQGQVRAGAGAPTEGTKTEASALAEEARAAQQARAKTIAPAIYGSPEVETPTVQIAAPRVNAYSSFFSQVVHSTPNCPSH